MVWCRAKPSVKHTAFLLCFNTVTTQCIADLLFQSIRVFGFYLLGGREKEGFME